MVQNAPTTAGFVLSARVAFLMHCYSCCVLFVADHIYSHIFGLDNRYMTMTCPREKDLSFGFGFFAGYLGMYIPITLTSRVVNSFFLHVLTPSPLQQTTSLTGDCNFVFVSHQLDSLLWLEFWWLWATTEGKWIHLFLCRTTPPNLAPSTTSTCQDRDNLSFERFVESVVIISYSIILEADGGYVKCRSG